MFKFINWKTVYYTIISILICLCIAIIGWFLYIKLYAPVKISVNTYKVGLQTLEDGTTKSFIDVKYFTNQNKNGREALEIKFNYLLDETQMNFYSQGVQIVANNNKEGINFEYYIDENSQYLTESHGHWYDFNDKVSYWDYFGSYAVDEDIASYYNYASGDDYQTTLMSTLPINDASTFRIQLGEDLFLMKFKGTTTDYHNEENLYSQEYVGSNIVGNKTFQRNYYYNNIYSFAQKIYEALQAVDNGQKSSMVFEFGNMFDYYQYDAEKGVYTDTKVEDSTKVIGLMKSYYSIYVEKTADGIQRASESLFNCVHGSSTFNISGILNDGYFIGRPVIDVDVFDFYTIDMGEGLVALKLTDEFVTAHEKYKSTAYLSICISKDILKSAGFDYFTFAEDSELSDFKVFECYSLETVNGEVVRVEVSYE